MSTVRQIVVLRDKHVSWLKAKQKRDGICMSESVRRALSEAMRLDPIGKAAKHGD